MIGYCVLRKVALLAEGVDRNLRMPESKTLLMQSPSSRRAWIEMIFSGLSTPENTVALLAEGVDRNMVKFLPCGQLHSVALLAEGVDRNTDVLILVGAFCESPSSRRAWIEMVCGLWKRSDRPSRPPRGGRG